ncbi:hypothetical protein HDE_05498 [Halotydeus destructor]|nr:hypothetical protein HDE_05498 [Halotydeus destructor]
MNEVSATEKSVTDKNSNGVMTEDATVKLIAKDTSNIVESGSVTQSAKAIVGAVNGEVGVSKQIGGNVSDKPREPVNGIHEVSNGDVEESVKETLDAVSKSVSDNVSRLEENVDSMKSSELSPAKSSPKEHQQIAKEPKASSLEAKVPKKPIDDVKPEVSRKIPMPEIEHKPSGSLEALKDDSLVKDESDSSKPSESSGVPDETVQKLDDNIDLPSEVNEKPVANLLPEKKAQSGKLLETSKPVLAVQEDLKSTETEAQEKKVVRVHR